MVDSFNGCAKIEFCKNLEAEVVFFIESSFYSCMISSRLTWVSTVIRVSLVNKKK